MTMKGLLRVFLQTCATFLILFDASHCEETTFNEPATQDGQAGPETCEGRCQARCEENPLQCEFIAGQVPVLCENTLEQCLLACTDVCICASTCSAGCATAGACDEDCMDDCFQEHAIPSSSSEGGEEESGEEGEEEGEEEEQESEETTAAVPVVYKVTAATQAP